MMEYPKLSCSNDKRKKICDSDKKEIIQVYKKTHKVKPLAKKFNVHRSTIYSIVNPEPFKKRNKSRWQKDKQRMKNDNKFKEKIRTYIQEWHKNRYDTDPKFRKYMILCWANYKSVRHWCAKCKSYSTKEHFEKKHGLEII